MTKKTIVEILQSIIDYPKEGDNRRTEDGYPEELVYDEFAYNRMVDSYRVALENLIKEIQ